ncbi:hypothetical protein BDV12DRAFT_203768 [Aspergillus spectabilis]
MMLKTTLLMLALAPAIFCSPTPNPKRALIDYLNIITRLTDATNVTTPDLIYAYLHATNHIQVLAALDTSDALGLVSEVQVLREATADMIDNLIVVRPNLIADGLEYEFELWLRDLASQMGYSRDAVADKAPALLEDIVWDLLNGIVEEVQRGHMLSGKPETKISATIVSIGTGILADRMQKCSVFIIGHPVLTIIGLLLIGWGRKHRRAAGGLVSSHYGQQLRDSDRAGALDE